MASTYKKGNAVIDSITYLIVILVFAIAGVLAYKIVTDANVEIQADPDMSQDAKETTADVVERFPIIFDSAFVFVVVLMWALVIVASFNIDAHPIFLAFTLILMTFVLFIGGIFANFFEEFIEDEELTAAADDFPKTKWIMNHLLHLILAVATTIMIALFGKNRISESAI